jgi:hypothetical protein
MRKPVRSPVSAGNREVKKLFIFVTLTVIYVSPFFEKTLSHKHSPGDRWRIVSAAKEDSIIKGRFCHYPKIAERVKAGRIQKSTRNVERVAFFQAPLRYGSKGAYSTESPKITRTDGRAA